MAKSRSDNFNPAPGAQGTFICSNHFPLGKRTPKDRETDYPSVFLTVSEHFHSSTPKKRKLNRLQEEKSRNPRHSLAIDSDSSSSSSSSIGGDSHQDESDPTVTLPMRFEQLTREFEVKFYTALPSTESFRCLFEHLLPKASNMQYWRGTKQTEKEVPKNPSPFQQFAGRSDIRKGPPRKLRLKQEFLLTLMKLRLALLIEDLSFRFKVSSNDDTWPQPGQVEVVLKNCTLK